MIWMFMFPQNAYAEILTPKVIILRGAAFGVIIRPWRRSAHTWNGYPYKRDLGKLLCPFHHVRTQHKDYVYEMGPHQTPNLLAPRSWTSLPLELWEVNFYCLSITCFMVFCYSSSNRQTIYALPPPPQSLSRNFWKCLSVGQELWNEKSAKSFKWQ